MDDASPVRRQRRKPAAEKPIEVGLQSNRALWDPGNHSIYDSKEDGDEDYLFFLKYNVEALEDDCADDPDPQYESFLKHLRQDGKSYTLLVEGSFGERFLCKYESEEDVWSEGRNVHPKRPKLINLGVSKRKECVASATKSKKVLRNENVAEREGKHASWKRKDCRRKPPRPREANCSEKPPEKSEECVAKRKNCVASATKSWKNLRNENAAEQDGKHASQRREDCWRKPPRPREVNCSEKPPEESEEWDESYLVFMHHIRNDGGVMLLNHDDGKVRYEEDEFEESSSSDLEILVPEDILRNKENNPFVTSRMTCMTLETDLRESEHSEFRRRLLESLKMPYDAKEYEDLLQKVKRRRLQEREIQLRGGRDRSYSTNILCESYLDQYPDLAEKISSAKGDQLRTLNLLRGFIFYLSNLPMEGVFRPWEDPSCLLILPPLPHPVKQIPSLKVEPSDILGSAPPKVGKQRIKAEPS